LSCAPTCESTRIVDLAYLRRQVFASKELELSCVARVLGEKAPLIAPQACSMKVAVNNNCAGRDDHLGRDRKCSWQKQELAPPSQLDQEIQGRLGQKLRTLYQELVNEPIPEKFVKLLNELEKWEG
jgi:hypothetical protein